VVDVLKQYENGLVIIYYLTSIYARSQSGLFF
jgi:hypothetical protein